MKENVWTEKYRPKTLDSIQGQEQIIKFLKSFVKQGNIPNMLFSGPPGVGKTATAIALCRDFYGAKWRDYYFEVNASDDSKVEFMRTKIKDIANTPMLHRDFKVIFLDESDQISHGGQAVLRRVIEKSSKSCRFIFSCNYPNKIIPAISDRCVVFRFKAIKPANMMMMLKDIVRAEDINITDAAISTLANLSNGSMRRALTALQMLKLGTSEQITEQTIYALTCWVDMEDLKKLLGVTKVGDLNGITKRLNDLLYEKTYMPEEILEFFGIVVKESDIPMNIKLTILSKIGTVEYNISQGAHPYLQLMSFMCYISKLFGGK
jgi:replication factor C small subunit